MTSALLMVKAAKYILITGYLIALFMNFFNMYSLE
jgi:hypothetical protein